MTTENQKPLTLDEVAGKVDVLAKYMLDQEKRRAEPPLDTGKGDDDDDGGNRRQRSMRSGSSPLPQIAIISSVVAAVVVMAMSSMGILPFVSKADFTKNVQGIIVTIDKNKTDLSATVEGLRVAVNNIPNTVATQVNTVMGQTVSQFNAQVKSVGDQANNSIASIDKRVSDSVTATQTSATATQAKVDSLTKLITDLQTANATNLTTIKTLTDRITALEKPATTTPTSKTIGVKIKQMGNSIAPVSDTSMTGWFRVAITNNTTAEIDDIILDIILSTDFVEQYGSTKLTGGSIVWQGQGLPWNGMEFMNAQWGLNLLAGETKTLYLTITITGKTTAIFTTTYPDGIAFDVSAEVL